MDKKILTADEIMNKTLQVIAPLPCQKSYTQQLAAIMAYHLKKNELMDRGFSFDDLPYQGALILSPTGTGKTHIIKNMSKLLGINTIVIDCSNLTRSGWKGPSLGQQLLASKRELNNDGEFAKSILILDEFDKAKLYFGVNDEGNCQDNILNLYNGGTIAVEGEGRIVENIDVSRFTIILAGAFEGIDNIIKKRINPIAGIGFVNGNNENKELSKSEIMKLVKPDDFVSYGIKRELIGRISSFIVIDPMETKDYECLLKAKSGSIQERYKKYFYFANGVDFQITKKAVIYIAKKCSDSDLGARAVNPIVNDVLRDAITMVDRDISINKIILDADDKKCFVRYKHGERAVSMLSEGNTISEIYHVKAESIEELTDNLCEIYMSCNSCSNNPEIIHELRAFLNLILTYFKDSVMPREFTYENVEKLCLAAEKKKSDFKSPLDIIITDALEKDEHLEMLDCYYEEFKKLWNPNMNFHLNKALNEIQNQVKRQHNCGKIRLLLQNYNYR